MTAFYGHCAVKAVSKSVSALAGFLRKCTMMGLKVDSGLLLRLIKKKRRTELVCVGAGALFPQLALRGRGQGMKNRTACKKMAPSSKQSTQAKQTEVIALQTSCEQQRLFEKSRGSVYVCAHGFICIMLIYVSLTNKKNTLKIKQ